MKIKKFSAPTEQEAIEKVKEELGLDALVINIKKIQPGGLFAFFKKPVVEVTAAFDERTEVRSQKSEAEEKKVEEKVEAVDLAAFEVSKKDALLAERDEKIQYLQEMLSATGDMLSRAQSSLSVAQHRGPAGERRYSHNLLQIFYDTLIENGVSEGISSSILDDLDAVDLAEKLDINFVVKIVYNSIISIIGAPSTLAARAAKGDPQVFAFIGPTGVGKTTTIAKLTADLILNRDMDVGLITADTYRIAAIEQLKTYGDILGIEVAVAYKPDDLAEGVLDCKNICDIVLIDTAGRSHKSKEHLAELKDFLDAVPECSKFLVLSLTTKYEDMLDIVNTFSEICEFDIIFTKLDETSSLGCIVNICHATGKKLSYITFGQNVPDDIKTIATGDVAMRLLGLGD